MTYKLSSLFKQIDAVKPTLKDLDKGFHEIRESIREVELESLPESLKSHFGLTGPEFDVVKLRRQYSVEDTATLAFAKRALSYLHGAQNVVLHGKHKTLTSDQSQAIFEDLAKVTKNFLQELEVARVGFTIKGQVKAFEAKQFQHYLAELNRVLSKSIGKDYHKTYADLLKAEQLACWRQRPTIATFNHYEKSDRLIIERPMVTTPKDEKEETAKREEYPFCEYRKIPAIRMDNYRRAPQWFRELKPIQQNWLIAHRTELMNGKLGCPPAILRYVPGAANFTEHDSYTKTKDEVDFRKVYRHSTARPIDMKAGKARDDLRDANGLQIIKTIDPVATFNKFWNITPDRQNTIITERIKLQPIMLERSLLSPLVVVDSLFTYKENNNELSKDDLTALKKGGKVFNEENAKFPITVLGINWPINAERGANDPFDKEHYAVDAQLLSCVGKIAEAINTYKKQVPDDSIDLYDSVRKIGNFLQFYSPFFTEANLSEQLFERGSLKRAYENLNLLFKSPKNHIFIARALGLINEDETVVDSETSKKLRKLGLALEASYKLAELWRNKLTNKEIDNVDSFGRNRRLFVLGYEDFIMQGIGGVDNDACKSSRDRAGTEEIHTDAMERCYLEEGFLPDYYDDQSKRDIFINLVAEEFINGHQQTCAGENSDGGDGIKDGKGALNVIPTAPMLPADIQAKIDEKRALYLETQNVLAKTNKPKIDKNPYAPRPFREKLIAAGALLVNLAAGAVVALGMLGIIGLGWPVTIPLMVVGIITSIVLLNTVGMFKNNLKVDGIVGVLGAVAGVVLHYFTFGLHSLAIVAGINLIALVKAGINFATPGFKSDGYKSTTVTEFSDMQLKTESSSNYQKIEEEYNKAQNVVKNSNIDSQKVTEHKHEISSFLANHQRTLNGLTLQGDLKTDEYYNQFRQLLITCFTSPNEEVRREGLNILYMIDPTLQANQVFQNAIEVNLPRLSS